MALTVTFQNDRTGTDESANYKVVASVNGKVIATTRVEGHNRADDWRALILRLTEGRGLTCEDCTMQYADFPMDVVLPDKQWLAIHPEDDGNGILCARCIVKRGERALKPVIAFLRFVEAHEHDAFRSLKNLEIAEVVGLHAGLQDVAAGRVEPLDDLVRQHLVLCSHANATGGNDYMLCEECGLQWDYRKGWQGYATALRQHWLKSRQSGGRTERSGT